MLLAELFPSTMDENSLVQVMIVVTAAVLLVVGVGIFFFAKWSKKEKERRARDVNTASNLRP